MRDSTIALLMDNLSNLSNRIHAVEVAFVDFSEENPKSSSQWQEERLRALEHQVKAVKEDRREGGDKDDNESDVDYTLEMKNLYSKIANLDSKLTGVPERLNQLWGDTNVLIQRFESAYNHDAAWCKQADWEIENLKVKIKDQEEKLDNITQGKDSHITRLENTVAELGLALGNLAKEMKDLKDAEIN